MRCIRERLWEGLCKSAIFLAGGIALVHHAAQRDVPQLFVSRDFNMNCLVNVNNCSLFVATVHNLEMSMQQVILLIFDDLRMGERPAKDVIIHFQITAC